MKRQVPANLPPNKNKKFWGDAQQIKSRPEKIEIGENHVFKQKGNVAICISCPFTHAIYLDPNQEVRDGKIVKRKPTGKTGGQ